MTRHTDMETVECPGRGPALRLTATMDCRVASLSLGGFRRVLEEPIPLKKDDVLEIACENGVPKILISGFGESDPTVRFEVDWIERPIS